MLDNLESISESIRAVLDAKNTARETLLGLARTLTRHCANAIRAMHRQEWQAASQLLALASTAADQMRNTAYLDLYFAGYTQDALKEYVEAAVVFALVRGELLPTPADLRVEEATYLNGLAEAASELRRYILDILRYTHSSQAEHLLGAMDAIYDMLVTFDFPDAISGGLRHRTDNVRAVLERTRGDMTTSVRQQQLQTAIDSLEARLVAGGSAT